MRIIGNKNLYRTDLFDILFNHVQIAIDNAIKGDFAKPKSDKLQIPDFKDLITDLNKKLTEEAFTPKSREFNNLFSRAYLFFILLAILRQRSKVRLEVAEFIADLLNKRVQYSFYNEPYTVLLVFYGEGGAGTMIASLGQLPAITADEKNFLLSIVEVSYFLALSSQNLHLLQNLLVLADTSYALSLEKNAVKQDFLIVKYETKSFNKFLQPTASAVVNLTSGSKFSKTAPTAAISSWVDIAAQVKNVVYDYLGSIVEECTAEENENLKDLKIASISAGIKDWEVYNILTTSLLNSLIPLIGNTVNRLNDSKELNKFIADKLPEYTKTVSKLAGSLQLFNLSNGKPDTVLGTNFTNLFKLDEFNQVLYDLVSFEGLDALKYLVSLNENIASKGKPTKPEEEKKDDKAPKKLAVKITCGKGTNVVFLDFATNLADKIATVDIDDQVKKFKEAYFNPTDPKKVSLLTDLTSSKNDERRKPQVPKGTRDMTPLQMAIRNKAMNLIKGVFLRHGAVEIDTPVFELKETLTGKYGEDSKLIYDLQDQGGQLLALRYDLTVPFARYLAMKNIQNIKRFHIAKVYRRDQPAMNKGRYREFYQCDYDIAGAYGVMVPDAEALNVLNEILTLLGIGKFEVKLNNRKLLDAIIELSGSPKDKFKQICSSIDKLDKEPWTEVRRELVQERGLTEKMADKIGEFVKLRGPPFELLKKLINEGTFKGSKIGEECLVEMEVLFNYLANLNCLDNFVFDLSLARGLDYYTGIIFEAVLLGASVGSIAGGGRYDNLVGMFSNKDIPAVGVSIGIERLFAILEEKYKDDPKIRCSQTEVLIASIGSGMVGHRLSLCATLWKEQINTETLYNENPKPQKQLSYALENGIPLMIFIGEDEIKNKKVKLKTLYKNEEITVENDNLIATLKEKIAQYHKDADEGRVVFQKEKEESKDNA